MTTIVLSNGNFTIVDDDVFQWASKYKWHFHINGYAVNNRNKRLHRFIMNAPDKMDIDHINGNKLDNRRKNLRLCSRRENLRNQKMHKDNRSGYKGVTYHQNMWRARICVNYKRIELGCYKKIEDAVKAYNEAAIKYHGKFARLNEV